MNSEPKNSRLVGPNFEELKEQYESLRSEWQDRLEEAKEDLIHILKYEDSPPNYLYISGRVKSLDSVYGKAVRMKMADPLNEMEDLLGLRIVCLYRSEISQIASFIKTNHREISERPRRTKSDDKFGYDAQHYKLTHYGWSPDGDRVQTKIELQIRTILMDAWASISHNLDYKSEIDIPRERKRDFYALSGALFSIDSQFEMLREERRKYAKRLLRDLMEERISKNLEVNRENLALYLEVKFPEIETPDYAVRIIEGSLKECGFLTIKSLDNILDVSSAARLDPALNNPAQHIASLYAVSEIETAMILYDVQLCRRKFSSEAIEGQVEKFTKLKEKYGLCDSPQVGP